MRKQLPVLVVLLFCMLASLASYGQKRKPAAPKPEPKEPVTVHVAIIDGDLPDIKVLMKGLAPDTRVFVAGEEETSADLFKRVAGKCKRSNERIASVSIFSHGNKGEFAMGMDKISPRNLKFFGEDFSLLIDAMEAAPMLLVYSCNSGEGKNGDKLMASLQEVFPGKIYLSNNKTGKGGDWVLEVANTADMAPEVINAEYLTEHYKHSIGL